MNEVNSREPELFAGMKQWSAMVAFLGGSGAGGNPAQRAQRYASNVQNGKDQVALIRGVLENEQLEFARTQTIRTNLVESLTRREAYLSEVGRNLERSARDFPRLGLFSYPQSIAELNQQLETYSPPTEVVSEALQNLRMQYDITDQDLAN